MNKKKTIIFLGACPPPYIGPTLATEVILHSKLKDEFRLIHCDTSDHREIHTLGLVDIYNIFGAFKSYALLFWMIISSWPAMIYIPISQTTLGYFRDAGYIFIATLFSRKVICHLRGGNFRNWYTSANWATRWLVRQAHSLVDGQIVLGEGLQSMFEDLISRRKIYVIPNGKDFEAAYYPINRSGHFRVLYFSNFIREKGILEVLDSVLYIGDYVSRVEYLLAGSWSDGATRSKIQKFLKAHESLPVVVSGPLFGKAKSDAFRSSDIFVLPTYYPAEGHPWVIVEAMAAGLPIITTDQGAIIESVKDGVNGFIVEKKNPQQIAEKIKFLIENPEIRKKMGEESRRLYLDNFTEEKMIERLSYAFNSVLAS